jgi:uncharacterized protein YjiS (DUF1127 family)
MDGSCWTPTATVPAVVLRTANAGWRARLEAAAIRAVERLMTWQDRARSRRTLQSLDDRLLRDIGIDRVQAAQEATRPFWRPTL